MSETFATVRGPVDVLTDMVRLSSGGFHDDVYLKVQEDVVNVLMQTGGRKFSTFATFSADYFDAIEGEAEAFMPVERYLDYLGAAASEGTVEMTFDGTEGDGDHPRLADYWEASGAMNVRIRLPGSEDDLGKIPWKLPVRFNENNEYVSKSCFDDDWNLKDEFADPSDQKTPPTKLTASAETFVESIVAKADFMSSDSDADWYPLVVEDGIATFEMEQGQGDDALWGTIDEIDVEGPDVSNVYKKGFSEALSEFNGELRLATAPSPDDAPDAPLTMVKEAENYVVRHILGSYSKS